MEYIYKARTYGVVSVQYVGLIVDIFAVLKIANVLTQIKYIIGSLPCR